MSLFIISSIQSSVQRELDRFFKEYNQKEFTGRFVTQSAFSQARLKIDPLAFDALTKVCVDFFYKHFKVKKWEGFRLVAIDGSEVYLPKNKHTIEQYGEYTTNFMNKSVVLARASKAYDVLNNITLDAQLVNRKIGEHTLAINHLEYLVENDLILMDRGYPSYDIFRNILEGNKHFCARVTTSSWKAVKKLIEPGDDELITEIKPRPETIRRYKKEGIAYKPMKVRFISVKLSTGEIEVLVTSLLDSQRFPCHLFKDLYHLRWNVEESYKTDKHRLLLENFSGKSIVAIMQDFYATILLANITAIFASGVEPKTKSKKYRYKINFTTALAKVKEALCGIFTRENMMDWIDFIYEELARNIIPFRPDRNYKRDKGKRKRYFRSYLHL